MSILREWHTSYQDYCILPPFNPCANYYTASKDVEACYNTAKYSLDLVANSSVITLTSSHVGEEIYFQPTVSLILLWKVCHLCLPIPLKLSPHSQHPKTSRPSKSAQAYLKPAPLILRRT